MATFLEAAYTAVTGRSEALFIDKLFEFIDDNKNNDRVFGDLYELLVMRERFLPSAAERERISINKLIGMVVDSSGTLESIQREMEAYRDVLKEKAVRHLWGTAQPEAAC